MMNDNYRWVPPVVFITVWFIFMIYLLGISNGEKTGRNQGIIYCMEQPEKCKIEFQYLKLTEKSK